MNDQSQFLQGSGELMHRSNWDDLRYVLAVAENGSVSAAARVLGVNHATVLRRVAAFESRHGGVIFDKTARGYSIAPDRLRVIDAAREVEAAVMAVQRMIEGVQAPLQGVVRVTSTDTFCHSLLPGILPELRQDAAGLQVDLLCSNSHLDLSRLHADVTVRPANTLPDELSGSVAARLGFAVYGTDNGATGWLRMSGALARSAPAQWLAGQKVDIAGAADSFLTLREMAAAGMGCSVLPCILGDRDPRLVRRHGAMPEITVDIWVASHADLADVPRIAAVRDHLTAALARQSAALLGQE